MGNDESKEEKQEQSILRLPNVGQASDFYWACRAGDVDKVKQMLATIPFHDLNHLEPNGSTALHAASFFGHIDVVRVLLKERGVMRHRKNRHGLTAYEEAANDEIRQLFHRPNNNRFYNDSNDNNENIFDFDIDQVPEDVEDDEKVPDDWIEGHGNEFDVRLQRSNAQIEKFLFSSLLLRSILFRLGRDEGYPEDPADVVGDRPYTDELKKFIDEHVPSDHREYDKACALLSKYIETKKPEYLLRLYTLETPFCYQLGTGDATEGLSRVLLMRMKSFKTRAFRGRTYRGLSMTKTNFRAYRWALKKAGSIISTKSFCSTSVDETVARRFMPTSCTEKLSVLMIFDFPEQCDAAIRLYALSRKLPSISDYENEREVLLLPNTMFRIVNITNENSSNHYTIHLENVLPKFDLKATWSDFANVK